jgi:hypothetical protein
MWGWTQYLFYSVLMETVIDTEVGEMAEGLLTTGAVARVFGVVPDTVRWWHRKGKLRAEVATGGLRLFRPGDIEEFREKRLQESESGGGR